uniref:Uncharacterized protein n=1 Tax=Rhizophora mucronata TaxID=61149 RepID=A0A2P2NY77_RHIMU
MSSTLLTLTGSFFPSNQVRLSPLHIRN